MVVVVCACPSRRDTVLTSVPPAMSSVAFMCRRLWMCTFNRSVRLTLFCHSLVRFPCCGLAESMRRKNVEVFAFNPPDGKKLMPRRKREAAISPEFFKVAAVSDLLRIGAEARKQNGKKEGISL